MAVATSGQPAADELHGEPGREIKRGECRFGGRGAHRVVQVTDFAVSSRAELQEDSMLTRRRCNSVLAEFVCALLIVAGQQRADLPAVD
jgi:hypothetical protein